MLMVNEVVEESAAEAAVMESRRKGCPLPCHKKQNTKERERIATERERIIIVITLFEMGADDLKIFRDYCADHADHNNARALAFIDTAIRIKNASAEKGNGSRVKQTGARGPRSRGADSSGR